MEKIRIGLMGCGTVANYGHLPVLAESDDFELVALFDPDQERVQAAAAKFGATHACTDPEAFMRSGIDAVTITSPLPCHLENVLLAAKHGKAILCEKPLAMNTDEAETMMEAADTAGVQLFTAFDYRFSPASLKIHELVAAGAIGQVRSLRLIYIWNCHGKYVTAADGSRQTSARRDGRMAEGGPLVDCGVHQIDLARFWLQSEVTDWHAVGAWVDDYAAPDHVYLHMDHESGAHTMVEISYSYGHTAAEPEAHFSYDLIGTEGVIRYDRATQRFEVRGATGTTVLDFAPEKNFRGMYDAFAIACRSGDVGHLPTAFDGYMAMLISRSATDDIIAERK